MYDPELYSLVHRGTPGDEAFYAAACRGARVLELGCGYGRLIPSLSAVAKRYLGLDHDPGMLQLAEQARAGLSEPRRKRVRVQRADMRAPSPRGRFERVIIPHSGLYCLANDEDVLQCLHRARAVLVPGGELLLDAYFADPFHEESRPRDVPAAQLEHVASVTYRGVAHEVYEQSSWNRRAQRMVVTYRYVPHGGGPPLRGVLTHRYLLVDQLATLLHRAGFRRMSFNGDFQGGPLDDDRETLVVRAVRAG